MGIHKISHAPMCVKYERGSVLVLAGSHQKCWNPSNITMKAVAAKTNFSLLPHF